MTEPASSDRAPPHPNDPAQWLAAGEAALARGAPAEAEAAFARAQQLAPNAIPALDGLARAAEQLGKADGEIWARRQLASLRPESAIAHAELGDALRRDDRNDEAASAFFLARGRAPGDRLIRWLGWQTLPIVQPDHAALERARSLWQRELAAFEHELAARPPSRDEARALLTAGTAFHRHYLGEPLVEDQRHYGAVLRTLARAAHPELADAATRGSGGARLRVGFVSAHFREHTVAKLFARWVTDLDPARHERVVISLEAHDDAWTRRIRAGADRWIEAPADIHALPALVADARCDVLVHLDIGMHANSQLLPALRLAPVQATTWGHPITSGLETVDAYLTPGSMELPDADARYTERLVRLPRLSVDYDRPAEPSDHRVELPAGARGYFFCAQSAHKLHPGHDAVFASLCARNPEHPLVLVPHPKAHVRDALERRLAKAFRAAGLDPARHLVLLPGLRNADFLAVARDATVLLDSFDWSGANTTIEALASGTPVVTRPGTTMRARHTAAIAGLLGLDELVVDTTEAYVELAGAIAREPDRREALATTIRERNDALYRDPAAVPSFAAWLEEAQASAA